MNTGAPEEVLLRDRPIQMTVVVWLAISDLIVYFHPGQMINQLSMQFDSLHVGH
jgi:hypothetical protein